MPPVRPLVLATLSALLVTASAGAASAQAPAAPEEGRGSAPPPPAFAPPVFGQAVVGDEEPSPDSTPPGLERGGQIVEPSTKPSRFLLQVAAGPRYRRMYSADLSAFQLEVAVGGRAFPRFHPSGFLLGALGTTNQGLFSKFLSAGAELAFPQAGSSSAFLERLTPALRFRLSFIDIDRITRSQHIFGAGFGADAQLAADLYRAGPHALYVLLRVGVDGYLTEGEGAALFTFSSFGNWGGEAMVGFRY